MSSYARRLLWIVSFVSLFSYAASASTATTYLYLNSQPGDYIGQGITQTFTAADGTFAVFNGSSYVSINFPKPAYSETWFLDFSPPTPFKFPTRPSVGANPLLP